jgi:hypothetical protein
MRVSGALFLVVAVAAARAGDPPPQAVDSISQAKRDLASIKSPAPASEPGLGLGGMGAKDDVQASGGLRPEPSALLSESGGSALDPSKKKEGTGNWLVDAMEQKPDHPQSARERDDLIRGDLDLLKGADKTDSRAAKEAQLAEAGAGAASKELAASVYNPLDAFMSGWISAHDRELLLPARRGDSLMGGEQGRAPAETLPGIDFGQQGVFAESHLAPRDGLADSKPAANPYIGDLDLASLAPLKPLSAPDTAGYSPFLLPDLSRDVSASGLDPKLPDVSKSLVPDFTQPPDDDKYFRQMKRF